jgi:hypothetical protein
MIVEGSNFESSRILKKSASFVLSRSVSSRTIVYAPGTSLPAALLDCLFDHPEERE